jgi:hypothetical protein
MACLVAVLEVLAGAMVAERLLGALRKQSRLNAAAAFCATAAAIYQALLILMPTCITL